MKLNTTRPRPRPAIAELLGRSEQVVYGETARNLIRDKTVLVTGAGGSIGSELVRQLVALNARTVYMLDHDEGALHALQLELTGHGLLTDDTIVLADIRDLASLMRHFQRLRPEIVFHTAANKHLPLLERFPAEGIKTNVVGSHNVAIAAAGSGVRSLINVSTDKAASPTSVLGATKRFAEELTVAQATADMSVANVRFGNVLGSRGSLLDSLAHQIRHELPVTITDERVTRYFMTIPEAAGLVIEASVLGESGATYILDMGKPVRIVELARNYARMAGVVDPNITYTGLRPGEKMHEELVDYTETPVVTSHPRIWKAQVTTARSSADARLKRLEIAADSGDERVMRKVLFKAVQPATMDQLPRHQFELSG